MKNKQGCESTGCNISLIYLKASQTFFPICAANSGISPQLMDFLACLKEVDNRRKTKNQRRIMLMNWYAGRLEALKTATNNYYGNRT